jgi:hypothetical protein
MTSPREISNMLAQRILALAAELFPAGRRHGAEWRVGSPAGEAGQSLAIHIGPARPGVWCDFASGLGGDALDLVAQARFGGQRGRAIGWARAWLGLAADDRAPPNRASAPPPPVDTRQAAEGAKRTAFASSLFYQTMPGVAGTPVEAYLAGRGIDLRELGRQPGALRYHAALECRERGQPMPAMLAAVTGIHGELLAVHRTWLENRHHGWSKAALARPKMVLGPMAGGAVHLWRGLTGKSLRYAETGEAIVISEGIETGLSVAVACPELRVLAAISVGNLAMVELPPAIGEVIIAADNDAPESQATRAVQRAVEKFSTQGKTVRIARSPIGSDFNDAMSCRVLAG